MATNNETLVNELKTVNPQDLWDFVFGSGFAMFSEEWLFEIHNEGDTQVRLVVDDTDGGEMVKTVNADKLAQALADVVTLGYCDTCTGNPISFTVTDGELDGNFDACVGDVVVQVAVYGEVIYG